MATACFERLGLISIDRWLWWRRRVLGNHQGPRGLEQGAVICRRGDWLVCVAGGIIFILHSTNEPLPFDNNSRKKAANPSFA